MGLWVLFVVMHLVVSSWAFPTGGRSSQASATILSGARVAGLAGRSLSGLRQDVETLSVVRVAGTPALVAVRDWIQSQLSALGVFEVALDSFVEQTPLGSRQFHNIVATYNPSNRSRVVFAAHYDSKWFPDPNQFVASTDSAVPCAMLLDLATTFAQACEPSAASMGIQFVFFDGEEAFKDWTATDSLYGSRHLAAKWAAEQSTGGSNSVARIDMMVLLDLIGHSGVRFLNWFPQATGKQFTEMGLTLRMLKKANLLHDNSLQTSFFGSNNMGYGGISDDHEPFLKLGVPIMHLIAFPFPPTWHTPRDNVASLDWNSTEDLMKVFRVYMASVLNLTNDPSGKEL